MKLNLLPTHVGKEGSRNIALFMGCFIVLVGVGLSIFMKVTSDSARKEAYDAVDEARPKSDQVVALAASADQIIKFGEAYKHDTNLAQAMMKHNSAYVDLYKMVFKYVPDFFRVTSIQAAPSTATNCVVQMNGIIHTYQEYADLMLALYRIPGAQTVSRTGYNNVDATVPALDILDQVGVPTKPGEGQLPSDPVLRMQMLTAENGQRQGFTGISGFGVEGMMKGPMPDWSAITVAVAITGIDLQTPDPQASMKGGGGGAPAANGPPAGSNKGPGPGSTGGTTGGGTTGGEGDDTSGTGKKGKKAGGDE